MAAPQLSDDFWRLFAIYIKKLCKEAALSSPSGAVQQLEGSVLPLLDRLDFLTQCRDLHALETILSSLHSAGYQLPLSTIQALSADLLFKSLTRPRGHPSSATSPSSDLKSTRLLFDFVKRSLNCSFHSLREAIASALSKVVPLTGADGFLQARLCLLEEEVCWGICDEKRLLQYVLECEEHISNNEPDAIHIEPPLPAEEGSRLAGFIRRGLQSQETDARLQAIKLAVACSFHSHLVFSKFFPLFQTALYLEDSDCRQYVLGALMDLIYMHQRKLTFNSVAHLILPFLYAPTSGLQLVAVIGCGRLLLYDCFSEETECLLSAMIERYVYDPYIHLLSNASSNNNVKLDVVVKAMRCFFQEYSGGKKLHQDEIANALVFMCLEKIEEGVVLLVQGANEQGTYMKDNPERAEESKRLHLALHFGLSISESALDALLDSLVLNINEQRRAVLPHHQVPCLLTRKSCQDWLLQCSL